MTFNTITSLCLALMIALLPACATKDTQTAQSKIAASMLSELGEEMTPVSKHLTFDTLPVEIERLAPVAYQLPTGNTHWYEVVYTPSGGINWVQAKSLAEQAGGYLVSIHSEQENNFVFSLVTDEKFWYLFDHGDGLYNFNGPFLGGFQVGGSAEPDSGWRWVSGEPMTYLRWQQEGLPIGNKIKPDTQPNDNGGIQNVMAFGEVDEPMSYWSDVPHTKSTYGSRHASYAFIIEYENDPN